MQWDPKNWELIERLSANAESKTAVFDADGTLWPGDIGESFFKFQIEYKLAPGLIGVSSAMQKYRELEKIKPSEAYSWLAKINAGLPLAEIQEQCRKFLMAKFSAEVFPPMQKAIEHLSSKGFEIFVCSASVTWPLQILLNETLGLPVRVIAFDLKLDSKNMLTDDVIEPLPYSAGKKAALEKNLKAAPHIVFGNSMGDFEMLSMAQNQMVIRFEPQREPVKASEDQLREKAKSLGWPTQIFAHQQ